MNPISGIIESCVSELPPAEFLADYLAGRYAGRRFAFLEWLHDDMVSRGINLPRHELQAAADRVVKPRGEPVIYGYDFDSGYGHLLPLPELKIVTGELTEHRDVAVSPRGSSAHAWAEAQAALRKSDVRW